MSNRRRMSGGDDVSVTKVGAGVYVIAFAQAPQRQPASVGARRRNGDAGHGNDDNVMLLPVGNRGITGGSGDADSSTRERTLAFIELGLA